MVNKVILLGRLCADPELRATPEGKPVTSIRVATNHFWGRDEGGNRKESAEFHNVVLFGRLAEIAGTYLRKGRLVYTEGHLKHSSREGQDGQMRYRSEVVASALQLVGPRPDGLEADTGG
jgi:single-strand DNA-binding protein